MNGSARTRVYHELVDAMRRHLLAPGELEGVEGRLHLCADGAGEWTIELAGRRLWAHAGLDGAPDAWLGLESSDLAGFFSGEQAAPELFNQGRVRLRGDVRLAMRLASFLFR